jgi:hypothetical protein
MCIQLEVKEEHGITTFFHCVVFMAIFSLRYLIIFPRVPIMSPVTHFPSSVESAMFL